MVGVAQDQVRAAPQFFNHWDSSPSTRAKPLPLFQITIPVSKKS